MTIKYTYSDKPLQETIKVNEYHRAQCHCGQVKFTLHLPDGLVDPSRCNCSLCKRRGTVMAFTELNNLTIDEGAEVLTLYQFNTNTAKHYFCSLCGVYTHHQRRSNPNQYSFNIACLDDVDPFVLKTVPVLEGQIHPSDR